MDSAYFHLGFSRYTFFPFTSNDHRHAACSRSCPASHYLVFPLFFFFFFCKSGQLKIKIKVALRSYPKPSAPAGFCDFRHLREGWNTECRRGGGGAGPCSASASPALRVFRDAEAGASSTCDFRDLPDPGCYGIAPENPFLCSGQLTVTSGPHELDAVLYTGHVLPAFFLSPSLPESFGMIFKFAECFNL